MAGTAIRFWLACPLTTWQVAHALRTGDHFIKAFVDCRRRSPDEMHPQLEVSGMN